jgi:hypothetical protein
VTDAGATELSPRPERSAVEGPAVSKHLVELCAKQGALTKRNPGTFFVLFSAGKIA